MTVSKAALLHAALGLFVLLCLFVSVHNRNVSSETFGLNAIKHASLDERWNDLSDYWRSDGWWSNGGLYHLNQCEWFNRTKESGGLSIWLETDPATPDANRYYYRSNTMLWLVPLHVAQSAVVWARGGAARRSILVIHNQLWPMFTAMLLGLSGTLLARKMHARWIHALLLGVTCQIVLQTSPLNLGAYWGFYMQHAFAFAVSAAVLSLVHPNSTVRIWLRSIAVVAMVFADLPHALVLLVGWAVLNLIISRRLFQQQRWVLSVLFPAAVALTLVAIQYAVVAIGVKDSIFVGSDLLFRMGLDGNTTQFDSLWDGAFGFIYKSPLSPRAPGSLSNAVIWILGGAASIGTLALGSHKRDLGLACYVLSFLGIVFLPFFVLFPNTVAIHPYAYPAIALPLAVFALCVTLPLALRHVVRRFWPVVFVTLAIGFCLTGANLRSYAIERPIDPTNMLIRPALLTNE